jgi:hypothetical protein
MAPVPPGSVSSRSVVVGDPGAEPIVLGPAALTGPNASGLSVASDGCAGAVLEPRETCAITVLFRPATAGNAGGQLHLGSDEGPLTVPLAATATSVSALSSPQLAHPNFAPTRGADGVGYPRRWSLTLSNPINAAVSIDRALVSGPDARLFRLESDRCAHITLAPHRTCRLSVLFTPHRAGIARAQLTLLGVGTPLIVALRPVAYPLATVLRVAPAHAGCNVHGGEPVLFAADQPATVHWRLARVTARGPWRCSPRSLPASAGVAAGARGTARRMQRLDGVRGYMARWRLPVLPPGRYALTVSATNRHGAGPPRSLWVTGG